MCLIEIRLRYLGRWRRAIAAGELKAWDLNLLRIPGVICNYNINLLLGRYMCTYVAMKLCTDILSHWCNMQLSQM